MKCWAQLLLVVVLATVAGVAACMVADLLAVVAVVEAVVAAVTVEADDPLFALAAIQPVRTAAVAKPATADTRRALRAG